LSAAYSPAMRCATRGAPRRIRAFTSAA
jgi:hypothetical protein